MTPRQPYASELFARAGVCLYGEAWQSPLAQLLGLNLRTVQRIARAAAAGEPYRIPSTVMDEVRVQLRERERTCKSLWMDITNGWADA